MKALRVGCACLLLSLIAAACAQYNYIKGPFPLNLKTYPPDQGVRNAFNGAEVVFQCRDEGPFRAAVKWVRQGNRPLKPGSVDLNGRLIMNAVTAADSGVYVCQAVEYLGQPNSEVSVILNVDHTLVNGNCEPNQFKCNNNKCVLKTWRCDSEDDCGDGSDEQNCVTYASVPGQCTPVEFACTSGDQCVPKSYHCDGQSDCVDESDEIGCAPVYVTRPPQPSNVHLNVGDTLTLECAATGTPTPIISWHRNWGDVPENCRSENTQTAGQVISKLVCTIMQPEHSGAYSCEAMNTKSTIFAFPDAIVFVNRTSPCPSGYFNSEARSESECIRCFCFGESTTCRSADLFIYNMTTALGEGGTRLVGVKNPASGDVEVDKSFADEYYYQPLRNGATVIKLVRYGYNTSGSQPYITPPENYNGNRLTSYGGHIRYRLTPHLAIYNNSSSGLPDIIVKGKYQDLFHFNHGNPNVVEARFIPGNWEKAGPQGRLVPATREDIMMALANIELVLLGSSVNNAGVNITDFAMGSARRFNTGLGAANLVEKCSCPPGYEGLSCQKCDSGFVREQTNRWLGDCKPERTPCPPGTYGDPNSGYACRPCPCPLTNRENQFARTCSIGSSGTVECDCNPGYKGKNCEYCAEGYQSNPLAVGDSCKPKPRDICNPVGTSHVRLPDECECKDHVQGRYCDQCKNDSYYLSNDFKQGCALCFCLGVSQQCRSSNLRRKVTTVSFNNPDSVNRVKVYSSTPLGTVAAVRYHAPVETNLTASFGREELVLTNYDRNTTAVYYWSLPIEFVGDKVTSYGGYLRYKLNNVPAPSNNSKNNATDVQLIGGYGLTIHYFGNFESSFDGVLDASVQFLEKGWKRPDGKEVAREHFLLALADVKAILVKMSYTTDSRLASLISASIDTAELNGVGPAALHVEQCVCPREYVGTSCEDCAPGYTRLESGLYLEHCGPCQCNGHSTMCDPENGVCFNCQDNTDGDYCEQCRPGYKFDVYGKCVPESSTPNCNCNPAGSSGPCDENGNCACKVNVEGPNCDVCRRGTFGLDASNPDGCYACYCSGATSECHEVCICPPGYSGTSCESCANGYYKDRYGCQRCNCNGHDCYTGPDEQVVCNCRPPYTGSDCSILGLVMELHPTILDDGRPDSLYRRVILTCKYRAPEPLTFTFYEEGKKLDLPKTTESLSWFIDQLGMLIITNLQVSDNGRYICQTTDGISTAQAYSMFKVKANAMKQPTVEIRPPINNYFEGERIQLECIAGGYPTPTISWQRNSGRALPQYAVVNDDLFIIENAREEDSGEYRCTVTSSVGSADRTAVVNVRSRPSQPSSEKLTVSHQRLTILERQNTSITCTGTANVPVGTIAWVRHDGIALDANVRSINGVLHIDYAQITNQGVYICYSSLHNVQPVLVVVTVTPIGTPPPDQVPAVNTTEKSLKIPTGGTGTVDCNPSGFPLPLIRWKKNDESFGDGTNQRQNTLIITNARESDQGYYLCEGIINGQTVASLYVYVEIEKREAPIVSIYPEGEQAVTLGSSFELRCTVLGGVPEPLVTWSRAGGRPLSPLTEIQPNNILYFNRIEVNDEGEYLCSATNVAGTESASTIIKIRSAPVVSITPTQDIHAVYEDTVRVECRADGYPQPMVSIKNEVNEIVAPTPGIAVLNIPYITDRDQGEYTCLANSPAGTIEEQFVINVDARGDGGFGNDEGSGESDIDPDSFLDRYPGNDQPRDMIAIEGQITTIRCAVTGNLDVQWTRADRRPLQATACQEGSFLVIRGTSKQDSGQYVCNLIDRYSGDVTNSATTSLVVLAAPRITLQPPTQTVHPGDSLIVECVVDGDEVEPIVWRRITRPFSSRVKVHGSTLIFNHIEVEDGGKYECLAKNRVARVAATAEVIVSGDEECKDTHFRCYDQSRCILAKLLCDGVPDCPDNSDEENCILREKRLRDRHADYSLADKQTESTPAPLPQPTVFVKTTWDKIKIEGIGGSVNFTCQARGLVAKKLAVTWSKKEGNLPQERTQFIEKLRMLIITNLQESDSGRYICQTTDGTATAEAYLMLTVKAHALTQPTAEIRPPINDYFEGERIQLECIAGGYPTPTISWQRNSGRALPQYAVVNDHLFIIENAREEDSGEYRCTVTNSVGSADCIVVVNVSLRPPQPSSEKLTVSQQRTTILEGQNTSITCTGTTNVPVGTIDWVRQDGAALNANVRSINGVLHIDYAQTTNQGVYICHSSLHNVQPVLVVVTVTPIGTPPPDQVPAVNTTATLLKIPTGGTGTVECNPSGFPLPLIRWKKHDESFGIHQRQNTLIITNARESDQGYYICEGILNGQAVAHSYIYVEIEKREAPRISINPGGEQAVTLGSPFELRCTVLGGVPEPSVTWNRAGGRPFSPLTEIQPNNTLYFNRIEVNDEGEYLCSAANIMGTESASTIIKVRSAPVVSITPTQDIHAVHGDTIRVECRADGYPQPMVSIKKELHEIIDPTPGIAVLNIPYITDRDQGDYTCLANSSAGTIEEQFDITVDERGDGGFDNDEAANLHNCSDFFSCIFNRL